MIRLILVPGLAVVLIGMSAVGYGLWQFRVHAAWTPRQAYSGNVAAERHLASCYRTGCSDVPPDADAACAWRHVIMDERKHPQPADIAASHAACRHLSASDQKWVEKDERDIRKRMGEKDEAPSIGG